MTTNIEARFVGHSDHGYHHGHTYQIKVTIKRWSAKIIVIATHGYHLKPVGGMELIYGDLTDFFKEWKTLRVKDSQATF